MVQNDHEGWLEHASHLVLLAALVAWGIGLARLPAGLAPALGVLFWAWLCFALLEEVDYGQVYGVDLGYRWLEQQTGYPSLHHSRGQPATMLQDRLLLVAGPGITWALSGLVGPLRRALGRAAVVLPTPAEGVLFLAPLALYAVLALFVERLHDVFQVPVYVVLLLAGVRVARGR